MQVKSADDKQPEIDALDALLRRPDLDADARRRLRDEVRMASAGRNAEREAAYEIEFHYGGSKNFATIHDLRIECDGRIAQIDHIIVNRFFDMWICESKSFSEGVEINEYGEWTRFYQAKPYGIPSPIEQIKRHAIVLEHVFARGLVRLPRRLGIKLRPRLRPVVLISNRARISRPEGGARKRNEDLNMVIKSEQLIGAINRSIDQKSPVAMLRLVGQGTIRDLAQELAALHSPLRSDPLERFGLSEQVPRTEESTSRSSTAQESTESRRGPSPEAPERVPCASCGKPCRPIVVEYCRSHAASFGGRIFCVACQGKFPRPSATSTQG